MTLYEEPRRAMEATVVNRTLVVRDAAAGVEVGGIEGHTVIFVGRRGSDLRRRLAAWLRDRTVQEAAEILGISAGNTGRLRVALGVGQSQPRGTRWPG